MVQGWGMTETSPLARSPLRPGRPLPTRRSSGGAKTGRVVPGSRCGSCADDGTVLAQRRRGRRRVRGPRPLDHRLLLRGPVPDRFHDGWLRTGDIGSLDRRGYMQISDRTKDVIKSGGEWISSVELESEVMAHPDVFEAAVIAVPDRTVERAPAGGRGARGPGASRRADELLDFLAAGCPSGGCPSAGPSSHEVPKTSVGKFDKKVLRAQYHDGQLDVTELS